MKGVLIYGTRKDERPTGAWHMRSAQDILGAVHVLGGGGIVFTTAHSLVTGWRAPEGTLVVFTPSFFELFPLDSGEYMQACARVRQPL